MRTGPSVAQTRVPVASCGHLPDAPLGLAPGVATPLPAPTRIRTARRVARDVHHEAPRFLEDREACTNECERSDDVDLEHPPQDLERVIDERGERGRTEFGRVVDEQIQ